MEIGGVEMNIIKIKFSSITHALKAKEVLSYSGYKVKINKNPNPSVNEGCGYSINISGNADKILIQLDLNKVKYLGFELIK